MISKKSTIVLSLSAATLVLGAVVYALKFTPPEVLSSDGVVTGDGMAYKTKIVGMSNGLMVSVYGDTVSGAGDTYDLKNDEVRKARDVFVRTCMPGVDNDWCSSQDVWSAPVNISNTATQTSASSKFRVVDGVLQGEEAVYGDSDKPNIFNMGTFAVVTWVDKYCGDIDGGADQRIASYSERGGLSVPFSCVYESHINFADADPQWKTTQLTSGERDAKQDANKGVVISGKGKWIITWQEDPRGLQIGGGDGPGDGASGANVTHGTDIWQSATADLGTEAFSTPVRLTDNFTKTDSSGNAGAVYDQSGAEVTELESGNAGASRANLALVMKSGSETSPTVIVTYEETKGSEGMDDGKYIRYHNYPFTALETNASGTIISDPAENSRRVRFVTQTNPSGHGLRMGIFWRQGNPTEGGPGDIMVRLGYKDSADANSTGLRPEDMLPAVDPNAATSDYAEAMDLNNTPAYNISSNTIPWSPVGGEEAAPTNTLTDTTDKNAYEDARAHRAVIRGDDFYIGYTYTKDWGVATYTDLDNYNFWMRHFDAVTETWTVANNLSNITDKTINVKEPRLVGMPGTNTSLCPTDPEYCQDQAVLMVAWGTETNVYASSGESAEEGDIYYTRTKDKGTTFTQPAVVEGIGSNNRGECQLRTTPAGNIVVTVWNEKNNVEGGTYSMLSVSTSEEEVSSGDTNDTNTTTATSSGSGSDHQWFDAYDSLSLLLTVLGFLGLGAFIARRKLAR